MRHAYKAFRTGPVTVFDLMRDREEREAYEARLSARAEPSDEPPAPLARPGDDLTLMQRVALLRMMNSTFARGVAQKLTSNEGVQDRPSLADYCELSRRFLCERLPGGQYHELTFEGARLAKKLLARICADLDVHVMQVESVTGTGRDAQTYYRCSCGGWGRTFRGNGQFAWRRAANAFHSHWNPLARGVEA